MTEQIRIIEVEKDGEDGLIVTFSDGTICGYVAEELLEIRPIREKVKKTPHTERKTLSHPLSIPAPLVAVH
ncbi:MAG: hypothetical protein ACLP07_17305 [Terracidiphilus sp.]